MTVLCSICSNPILLVPSAEERAAKSGKPASYYLNLFTEHASCTVTKRHQESVALMRRIRNANK